MRLMFKLLPAYTDFQRRMAVRIQTFFRVILITATGSVLSACSTIQLAEMTRGDHVAGQLVRQTDVLDHYQISRQLSYPLSSRATLFVNGKDADVVASLTKALELHFKVVQLSGSQTPGQNTGFLLVVDKVSEQLQDSVPTITQERTPAEKLYDRLFTPALAWSYQIKVVDIDSQTAFDQLTIRLKRQYMPESAERDELLNSAFRYAAAKLAGQA